MRNELNYDRRFKIKLEECYPDKNIIKLSTLHNTLYLQIYNYIKDTGLTIEDYITSLGFHYEGRTKFDGTIESILSELIPMYPDKKIESITDITNKYPTVYYSLRDYINHECAGKDTSIFLEEHGFTVEATRGRYSKYDLDTLFVLKENYDFVDAEFARFLGIEREAVRQLFKRKNKESPDISWKDRELSSYEIDNIYYAITNYINPYINEKTGNVIRLYMSKENSRRFAILSILEGEIKVLFDVPQDIYTMLIQEGYHKYTLNELNLIKMVRESADGVYIDDGYIQITDEGINGRINALQTVRKRVTGEKLQRKYYVEFLFGYKLADRRKKKADDVIEFLKSYADEDGFVSIPFQTEDGRNHSDYQKVARWARETGINGIQKFIESYGFKYSNQRHTNTLENYRAIVQSRYVVVPEYMYIESLDPFYNTLYGYYIKHKQEYSDFNALIKELGFNRLQREELPTNYVPYDWQKDVVNRLQFANDEEGLKQLLNEYVYDGLLYLDTSSKVYYRLWRIAATHNISINELLENWGYARTYDNSVIEHENHSSWLDVEDKDISGLVTSLLEELMNLQSKLEVTSNHQSKVKRNRELVKKLKKLYNYRCQLCSPDSMGYSSQVIEKADGTLYVELHHIEPLAGSKYVEHDESENILDKFSNGVIVCPQHHKYLHFHHGGNFKLRTINDQLYFVSPKGERLRIYTNYHLKASEWSIGD